MVSNFLSGAPDFSSKSWGDVDHSLRPMKSNLAVAKERSVKVRLCKDTHTRRHTLCYEVLLKQQATGKIWSPCTFEGFLLYKRDTLKNAKVANINPSLVTKGTSPNKL